MNPIDNLRDHTMDAWSSVSGCLGTSRVVVPLISIRDRAIMRRL